MAWFRDLQPRCLQEWIEDALDAPMVVLSLVFLALILVQFAVALSPGWARVIALAEWVIWLLFAVQFLVLMALSRDKSRYLRRHWLGAVSLILPFLRVFRALQALRALRALRIARLFTVTGRSMRQAGSFLHARGAGYVSLATLLVAFSSAAAMLALERSHPGSTILTYGDALWWAAAAITTVGSDLAPKTAEGRALAVMLYFYGMAVIGYITAILASYLIGKQAGGQAGSADDDVTRAAAEEADSTEALRQKVDHLIALLEQRTPPRRT